MCRHQNLRNVDAVRHEIGMAFQNFNLFPRVSGRVKRLTPQKLARGTPRGEARETAMRFLERVRIPTQAEGYPSQLTGGRRASRSVAAHEAAPFCETIPPPDPDTVEEALDTIVALAEAGATMIAAAPTMDFAMSAANRVASIKADGISEIAGPTEVA